jgi:hypothetical protein
VGVGAKRSDADGEDAGPTDDDADGGGGDPAE